MYSHWQEAQKFAIEGIKVLLLINGGAAVALLTFIGHASPTNVSAMGKALIIFGLGALLAAFDLMFGYLANLHYGNEELAAKNQQKAASARSSAMFWHYMGYTFFILSALFFVGGLVAAYVALVCA